MSEIIKTDQENDFKFIYILYGLSVVGLFIPLCFLIVLALAYVYRDDYSGAQKSHLTFLFRTMVIGLVASIVSIILLFVLIGIFTGFLLWFWIVLRLVSGLRHALNERAYPEPECWFIK